MRILGKFLTGALIATALGAAANADVVVPGSSFSGSSSDGEGNDAYGNFWYWSIGSTSNWADFEPENPYGGKPNATDFEITFTDPGAPLNAASFEDTTTRTNWIASISGSQVTFTAPTGTSLASGDDYSITVDFNGRAVQWAPFSAEFTSSGVPEPSTWAMMLTGFCALGVVGYYAAWRRSASA